MIRTAFAPVTLVFLLLAGMVAPARAMAARPSDDDPAEAAPLIVTGDFNRDGIADMAQVTMPDGDPAGRRLLTVLLGQRDGGFQESGAALMLGSDPESIAVGDFNGDGNPDVIVGDGDGSVIELLGDGKGNLVPNGDIAHLSAAVSIAVGDFNHDGRLDLAVADSRSSNVTVLLGSGDGSFRSTWSFTLPRKGVVYHLAAADFNGDGIPDLAVTNLDEETFDVMLGNGNGTFTYAPALSKVKDPNAHCAT
jgi:hypothetical protein